MVPLRWQYLVAIIIIVGFCVDVLESQFLPESGILYDLFFILDAVITGFFTFDLAVNLFANRFCLVLTFCIGAYFLY
jgi:hypothetical protein